MLMYTLLPNDHRFGGGRLRTSYRVVLDAIFFVLSTGCQLRALDVTVCGRDRGSPLPSVGKRRVLRTVMGSRIDRLRR